VANSGLAPRQRPGKSNYATCLDLYRRASLSKVVGMLKLAIRGHLEAHYGPATREELAHGYLLKPYAWVDMGISIHVCIWPIYLKG